jgi:predicted enzyme related to lactoylglutathione lyase
MKVSFGAVLIGVRDILKSKPFYENVFGITFDEVRRPFSSFSMNGVEFQLEENTPNRGDNWEKNYLGTPKGFCFETDSINEFLKLVSENGGTFTEPVDLPWGYKESHFTDPDGNDFIIEQKL